MACHFSLVTSFTPSDSSFFFFNDTATTEIYTLSLHDALPILRRSYNGESAIAEFRACRHWNRSEEHTSELQSQSNLVCRLLLEKKKKHDVVVDSRKQTNFDTVQQRQSITGQVHL